MEVLQRDELELHRRLGAAGVDAYELGIGHRLFVHFERHVLEGELEQPMVSPAVEDDVRKLAVAPRLLHFP